MKYISLLALKNAVLSSITDCQYVFTMVNRFLKEQGKPAMFHVQIVGLTKEVKYNDGLFVIKTDKLLNEVMENDLIIIPALSGDMISATHLNREYGHWIALQYKEGAEVASFCSGAFILAFTGLLKGKQCTTHWQYANEFKHFYPSVELVDEKVMTDQNGLYSSGGSTAYWNLLLHLIEKYTDRETAVYAAKYFVIDIDRNFQSPFIVFHGQKDHSDEAVKNIQEYIEQHYKDKLTVEQLADKFNISRRTFERRFRKATRNTVAEYIQKVKIEGAKKLLEIGRKSISEVMYDIGYSDTQTFREIFKRITGMTPVEYKNKYSKK
ncbi:GlxA family transcriptional regulator [Solitalea lacus]|uniref:GlxA family transcriptional regulator n=1 Tax=Solitalea lacus TaxID=2911172 RepID=UPI001EDB268E|nr:helix-turn-helix domain-containing protein [Solitalea lacus]UKJ08539.1 helix-turn-helix domain-containing protein [Solitalea lacus]